MFVRPSAVSWLLFVRFYRVDYDHKQATQWDWARVGDSFHEFKKFGSLVFK